MVGFPAGLSPTSFHMSPTSFHLSPWVLVVGFAAGLSPTCIHCLPLLSFVSQFFSFVSHFFSFPKQFTVRGSQCFKEWSPWCWMVWSGSQPACLPLPLSPSSFQSGFPAGLSPTSFHLPPNSFHLSPRPLPFICLPLLFIVSQAGCLWSGSGPACLPLPFICLPLLFICLPGWVLVVGFLAGLSPTSFNSPNSILLGVLNALKNGRLGAGWSGRVPSRLVSHFLSFVSQFFSFVSQAGCLWSGSRLACLPLPFICLPSFHLSPSSFHLSPRLGACGRVPGWLVSHFLSFVSHFFSFVSQAECLWWGFRLACLPLPCICLPLLFICLPG